jgi:hypothetical protein
MSQEEYDREMDELKERLNVIHMLLQEKMKENQRQGWKVKKVKWPVVQLFEEKLREILRNLKHRMNAWVEKEKLRGVEFRLRPLTEGKVHYCEPEQGDILGEDDVERRHVESLTDCLESEDERLAGSLMNSLESSDQQVDMLTGNQRRLESLIFLNMTFCVWLQD